MKYCIGVALYFLLLSAAAAHAQSKADEEEVSYLAGCQARAAPF
jgi:hypothetical protein